MSPSKPSQPRPAAATSAALIAAPDRLTLAHLPALIRPALTLARRGRAVIGIDGPADASRALASALLAFGLPEDAALLRGAPPSRQPDVQRLPLADVLERAAPLAALPLFPAKAEVEAFVAGLPDEGGGPGVPKDPARSMIFALAALVADPVRVETLRLRFLGGISWDDARAALAALILKATADAARHAPLFAAEADALDDLLAHGAARARGRMAAA